MVQEMTMNDAKDVNEWCKRWQWIMKEMAMNDERDDNEWCKRYQ